MARTYLVFLLLLNYLLVVGAGLVERPARVVDRPFPYVHSKDCQLTHQLRVACFDDCNGVQYTIKKTGERPPLSQLLTSLKGLDLHCLSHAQVVFLAPGRRQPALRFGVYARVVPTGYRGTIDSPPRRG